MIKLKIQFTTEEDLTYGFPYQTGGRVGLKGGGELLLNGEAKVYNT
jgi:hypothetical protein